MLEQLKFQGEQLKLALEKQRRLQEELRTLDEKCDGLSSHNGRLSRRLHEKEDEAEAAAEKVRTLRKDLQKAEASRREVSDLESVPNVLLSFCFVPCDRDVLLSCWKWNIKI